MEKRGYEIFYVPTMLDASITLGCRCYGCKSVQVGLLLIIFVVPIFLLIPPSVFFSSSSPPSSMDALCTWIPVCRRMSSRGWAGGLQARSRCAAARFGSFGGIGDPFFLFFPLCSTYRISQVGANKSSSPVLAVVILRLQHAPGNHHSHQGT